MERIVLGDVEIIRVLEYQGPFAPAAAIVPALGEPAWTGGDAALAPEHYDPASGAYIGALQTWVVRSGGRTVLVDTGVGAGRERPSTPMFHRREGRLPELLAAAGVRPEEVDVVVNTHLHADHVGWNTKEENGSWVPTFPNAVYFLPAADRAFFDPAAGHAARSTAGLDPRRWAEWDLVFGDSVAPVLAAGQAKEWSGSLRIDSALVLEETPGHTPGSSVLRVESGGERAVFVGDLMHSPVQLAHPSCNSCFCLDPAQAAASRLRVLERAAAEGELVIPAHFAGAGAARVRRQGAGFAADWVR
ncbi:MBL fold metallo-hydrolase [Streptomyces novaecaesareae]|uniref:MBL fold metallo-hydrolase n=1 Tax=Streptomyces novaecaesareae TaxID=68244 RepID=UPI0004AA274A|nr:MBL fold metallo-hydrolase [Streptomyces novaecaesareae]